MNNTNNRVYVGCVSWNVLNNTYYLKNSDRSNPRYRTAVKIKRRLQAPISGGGHGAMAAHFGKFGGWRNKVQQLAAGFTGTSITPTLTLSSSIRLLSALLTQTMLIAKFLFFANLSLLLLFLCQGHRLWVTHVCRSNTFPLSVCVPGLSVTNPSSFNSVQFTHHCIVLRSIFITQLMIIYKI